MEADQWEIYKQQHRALIDAYETIDDESSDPIIISYHFKSREKIIGLNKNETLMRTLFYYFAFFLELVRKGKNRVLKYVITILS